MAILRKKDVLQEARVTVAKANGRQPSRLTKAMEAEAVELGNKNWAEYKASNPTGSAATTPKVTKRSIVAPIYAELSAAGAARKDIVQAFMDEGGLTLAGARSYVQRFHSGEWE